MNLLASQFFLAAVPHRFVTIGGFFLNFMTDQTNSKNPTYRSISRVLSQLLTFHVWSDPCTPAYQASMQGIVTVIGCPILQFCHEHRRTGGLKTNPKQGSCGTKLVRYLRPIHVHRWPHSEWQEVIHVGLNWKRRDPSLLPFM